MIDLEDLAPPKNYSCPEVDEGPKILTVWELVREGSLTEQCNSCVDKGNRVRRGYFMPSSLNLVLSR